MNLRLVTTPLATPLSWPSPRPGGLAAALREACVPLPGAEAAMARLARPDAARRIGAELLDLAGERRAMGGAA